MRARLASRPIPSPAVSSAPTSVAVRNDGGPSERAPAGRARRLWSFWSARPTLGAAVIYAVLAVWGVYYLFTFWGGLGPGLAR